MYDPIWIESKRNVQMIDEGLRKNNECSKKRKGKRKEQVVVTKTILGKKNNEERTFFFSCLALMDLDWFKVL